MVELSSTQLLLSLKNTIVLWDLSEYKATLSFNLNNSPASQICLLDSSRLLVYDCNSLYVLDLAQQQMVKQIRLKGILKVVSGFFPSVNDVMIIQQEKERTLFIQYDLKVGYIKHSFQLAMKVVNAKQLVQKDRKYLFCIDQLENVVLIQEKREKEQEAIEEEEVEESLQNELTVRRKEAKENRKTFQNQYEMMHQKHIKREGVSEIFNPKSHMVTNVEYLLDEFLLNFSHLNV